MIEDYRFGNIKIDGKNYTSDIKIINGKVVPNWWRREGHNLFPEDIRDILEAKPEILVVGTGAYGVMKISSEVKELLQAKQIELIEAKTEKAAKIYNELAQSGKKVAFAAHLTC